MTLEQNDHVLPHATRSEHCFRRTGCVRFQGHHRFAIVRFRKRNGGVDRGVDAAAPRPAGNARGRRCLCDPESVEKPAEVTWQDPDHGEPVTLLTSPVSTELFEPTDDIGNTLIALEHTGLPPLSIAPGGGQGTASRRPNPASDSRTKAGTGNGIGVAGVGNGVGEGTGNGKGPGFFGRRMSGERVVYVVDSSQSMNHPHPGPGKTGSAASSWNSSTPSETSTKTRSSSSCFSMSAPFRCRPSG